jgi:hypothetical protein
MIPVMIKYRQQGHSMERTGLSTVALVNTPDVSKADRTQFTIVATQTLIIVRYEA